MNTKNNNLPGGRWQEGQSTHALKYGLPSAKKETLRSDLDGHLDQEDGYFYWLKKNISSPRNGRKTGNKICVLKYPCLCSVIRLFFNLDNQQKKMICEWEIRRKKEVTNCIIFSSSPKTLWCEPKGWDHERETRNTS